MKKNCHTKIKGADFIAPAMRAFRRVAKNLRADSANLGNPLVLGGANLTKDRSSGLGQ